MRGVGLLIGLAVASSASAQPLADHPTRSVRLYAELGAGVSAGVEVPIAHVGQVSGFARGGLGLGPFRTSLLLMHIGLAARVAEPVAVEGTVGGIAIFWTPGEPPDLGLLVGGGLRIQDGAIGFRFGMVGFVEGDGLDVGPSLALSTRV